MMAQHKGSVPVFKDLVRQLFVKASLISNAIKNFEWKFTVDFLKVFGRFLDEIYFASHWYKGLLRKFNLQYGCASLYSLEKKN